MNLTLQPQTARSVEEHRIVLVTGPSGAGRSTAVNVLEDLGYEAIDNLPFSLLPRLLAGPPLGKPMALGLDTRNRDFSVDGMLDLIRSLSSDPAYNAEVLYIDCRADVLARRYSETRRRHPMAQDDSPIVGIEREVEMLAPVRAQAHVLIDTSDLSPHDLRDEVTRWFDTAPDARLAVSVQSFSFKRGIPRGMDMVFDCRFLRNPHWDAALRPLDGRAAEVHDYIAGDDRFEPFFDKVADLVVSLLPAYRDEGKSHLSIGLGCTGGQHRSVAVAERLAKALALAGWGVSIRHRELERRDRSSPRSELG
ncbi:RNase adapter RapZ [Anianabacter salinae]|uniref:RNase adapter RapZ n=1 Tax=Anianabacter salinae TaxID=2851023 RepID=UPI00225DF9D2|nr:RNase adapter RapZ [Anianabacter salinae]MBV0913190.1 RNase adapter RapZ [Anianabacter salinae]